MGYDGREKTIFSNVRRYIREKIIVAGGGRIAERRVDTLLKFADNITVIAPKVTERIRKKAEEGKLCWIKESFREDMKNRLLMPTWYLLLRMTLHVMNRLCASAISGEYQ